MKQIAIIVLLLSGLTSFAQTKASLDTRWMMEQGFGEAIQVVAGQKSGQDAVVEMLAQVSPDFRAEELTTHGITVNSRVGNIITLRLRPAQIPALDNCDHVLYYQISHRVDPTCDEMRADTRTDSVQAGWGLPQGYDGEGVIIGITDWGFDYKHPNYNGGTENRRILRAWDHFRLAGPAPDGFSYGTELVGTQALKAAQCDTFGLYGYGTHGTHVTGIAAGRGIAGTTYIGQAPKASLLMCSFGLGEASWIDAVAWMKRVADEECKRLVINSSWGMYTFGTMDGTSLLSQAINSYSDSGVVFVTSGGNNGDVNFHLQHTFEGSTDTLRTIIANYSGGLGNVITIWGEPEHPFQIALGVEHDGQLLSTSSFHSTDDAGIYWDTTFVIGDEMLKYTLLRESANPLNQRPHITITTTYRPGYQWHLFVTAEEGTVHAWNLNNQVNHAGNIGYAFEDKNRQGYSHGDAEYGVGEPGCAQNAITVAAHKSNHYNTVNQEWMIGGLADFSSHGPIMGGMRKPEISAPGVNVVSSISSFTTESYTVVANALSGGRSYPFARMSGTSMSSPSVTGVVALMLQANPSLSTDQVREILFSTARNDSETGNIQASGEMSNTWGWGKVDAYHAVLAAIERLDIDEQADKRMSPTVFPNPATNNLTLRTGTTLPTQVTVFGIDGRMIWRGTATSETAIDLTGWNPGVYIINVEDKERTVATKFIKK